VDTPGRARAAAGLAGMHHASGSVKAKIKRLSKRIGEQHGPIDDLPKSHGRHHSQTGQLRVFGGKLA